MTQKQPPSGCGLELDALGKAAQEGDTGRGEILDAVGVGEHLRALDEPAIMVPAHRQDVRELQELDAAVGIAGAVHDVADAAQAIELEPAQVVEHPLELRIAGVHVADDADAYHAALAASSTSAAARSPARTAPSMKLGSSEVSAPAKWTRPSGRARPLPQPRSSPGAKIR